MTYEEFMATFAQRVQAALNNLATQLRGAGVINITVEEVTTEGVNDLRYRIVATKGNRTFTAYLEVTAAGLDANGQMLILITFWVDGNGSQIATSFTPGQAQVYNSIEGLDALLTKLTECEDITRGELLSAARAFLRV